MKKNKLLTMLLSVVMLLGTVALLTSCGSPSGNSGGSSQNQPSSTTATISFDVNIDGYQTNSVKAKTVSIGKKVPIAKAYITGDNPNNLQLYGWYTEKSCQNKWDFKKDRVQGDMTLYAKWVEQYTVNYYVKDEIVKTELAFKGDKLEEDPSLVAGFKYLGSYLDENYQDAFDYSTPVSGNTNLYLKRSAGIYMSDHADEGELLSSSLTDYLATYIGSLSYDAKGNVIEQEGWVETRTIITNYASGAKEENCTYVNFGYQPTHGDGYVELCLNLDITESQIIRFWFKNLGNADSLNVYFTAMLDVENNVYSETGTVYTQDFCYPNYTGSKVDGGIPLSSTQIKMSEDSEWTYVDFNLYEVYKNGYSIWGTSNFLGMLRFQANYKNVNEEDWSNEFLFKAIEGIPYDIAVEDSDEVKEIITTANNTSAKDLEDKANSQVANAQGLVFPKDFGTVTKVSDGASAYNSVDGLLIYAENEIVARDNGSPYYNVTMTIPSNKVIDLATLTTLDVTLQNFGYGELIEVSVYNELGIPVTEEIKIAKQMSNAKKYTVNLYGKYGMKGNLTKVEIRYKSVGVDNLILIESIGMSEFKPYDTVGINFSDKNCLGMTSNSGVDISFDSNRNGVLFNVSTSGASVVSSDRTYDATSDGYVNATLQYYLFPDSRVSAVKVEYKINGAYTSVYTYELDTENKGRNNSVTLPFNLNERGFVKGVRLTFVGTGRIVIKGIDYSVGATGLPFYESYNDIYKGWDWELTNTYIYDEVLKTSTFVKDPTLDKINFALYVGIAALQGEHISVPHKTMNVLATTTTKIKIVYQNKTDINLIDVIVGFARTDTGNPDTDGRPFLETYKNPIDCLMEEYEWSTLVIDVPADRANEYIGKINVSFAGNEISIRAISIETGV